MQDLQDLKDFDDGITRAELLRNVLENVTFNGRKLQTTSFQKPASRCWT